MDLKKLNEDELIQLCIEKGIEYLNPKTKKNYAKTTLISKIEKIDKDVINNIDIIEDDIISSLFIYILILAKKAKLRIKTYLDI